MAFIEITKSFADVIVDVGTTAEKKQQLNNAVNIFINWIVQTDNRWEIVSSGMYNDWAILKVLEWNGCGDTQMVIRPGTYSSSYNEINIDNQSGYGYKIFRGSPWPVRYFKGDSWAMLGIRRDTSSLWRGAITLEDDSVCAVRGNALYLNGERLYVYNFGVYLKDANGREVCTDAFLRDSNNTVVGKVKDGLAVRVTTSKNKIKVNNEIYFPVHYEYATLVMK
jgi:hypothetical protein